MSIDIFSIISVALLSSFGHCYFMCGGFNLAFLELNKKAKYPFLLLLTYHFSRIAAYVSLGLVFGFLGFSFHFLPISDGFLFFVLGIFMVFLGFALIFRGKALAFIEGNVFLQKYLKILMKKAFKLKGFSAALTLGFLNGFVPCGLVYFFLALALSKTSVAQGALVMLVFGLSTLVPLLFFGEFARLLSSKAKGIYTHISYILIICYGLYLGYLGFSLTRT